MRSAFVCVLTLLIWNQFERREATSKDEAGTVVVVDPFLAGRVCERHLSPSYLGHGDRSCWAYLGTPPRGFDRHLDPPVDRAHDYLGGGRARMHEIDVRELPCETSKYPSYIGNTRAWNACRHAKGLTPND